MWANRNVTTTVKNLWTFMTRAVWLNLNFSLNVISIPMFVINGHKDICSDSQGTVTRAFLPPHQLQKKSTTKDHGWNNRNSNTQRFCSQKLEQPELYKCGYPSEKYTLFFIVCFFKSCPLWQLLQSQLWSEWFSHQHKYSKPHTQRPR